MRITFEFFNTKESAPAPIPAPAPVTHAVTIQNFAFSPSPFTIKKGDTIVWTNKDSAPHTVTGGALSSGTLSTGQTYTFTFPSAGTLSYACNFHPSMHGTVVVQ